MANPLIATSFLVPTNITSSVSTVVQHDPTNVGLFTKWRRTWRSPADTGFPTLVFDFGVATVLSGVYLNNCNFTIYRFEKSSDGSSYTSLHAGDQTMLVDDVPNRRKVFSPASSWTSGFNNRYLRLVMGTVVAPSPGYFELGAMCCPSPITTLTRNFGVPWNFRAVEPVTALAYPGGGGEDNVEGPDLAAFDLQFGPNVKAARAQMMALRGIGRLPFFFYENRGDLSHAYVLKRTDEVPWSETFATIEAPWRLVETV